MTWLYKLKFLFTSTNAHGIHSPFVFKLVTQCFYKKRKVNKEISLLKSHFHKQQNSFQLQLLADTLAYLKIDKLTVISSKNHGIYKMCDYLNIKITKKEDSAKAFFIAANHKNVVFNFGENVLKDSCIILEAPLSNMICWNRLQNSFPEAICINTFYWGFLFIGKKQTPQKFNIRTQRFLKWDYNPVRF